MWSFPYQKGFAMKNRLPLYLALMLLLVGGPAGDALGGPLPLPDGEERTATADDDEKEPYTLSAAYPNPFRSRTKFDLRVEDPQQVSVEVYNILGQRVRTLYEGHLPAHETRTFTLKARDLPSGLYLYRIEGETFTAARRVMLVR
jgi:predicted small lipoprotein YifL